MEKLKVLGPPGTGKTTFLMAQLENVLQKYRPREVAFVSFTKRGTYEGKSRAMDRFDLEEQDLPYFRTIHSLCFKSVGASKNKMIGREEYKSFSEIMGMKFLGWYTEELASNNDRFLHAEQLERNNLVAFSELARTLNDTKYQWVKANYNKFKSQLSLLDFTDLLEMYIQEGTPLPVKVAFIDEAQDLTSLQWLVVAKMFSEVEYLVIAGDDDQAIYEWSGADVYRFLNWQGNVKILGKSYRLPKSIHRYASNISSSIGERLEKPFTDNGEEGEIKVSVNWKDLEVEGETLILARNNKFLKEAEKLLKEKGVPYLLKGEPSINHKVVRAIRRYEDCRKGVDREAFRLYSHMFKTHPEKENVPWYEAINLDIEEINYYRMLIGNKRWDEKPIVNLETIHSSKGSECDNVVLVMDVSKQINDNLSLNMDSELRCMYVGATRARKTLTLKLPETRYGFPNFMER